MLGRAGALQDEGGGCRAPPSGLNLSGESSTHPVALQSSLLGGRNPSPLEAIVAGETLRMNVSPAWPGCLCILYIYIPPLFSQQLLGAMLCAEDTWVNHTVSTTIHTSLSTKSNENFWHHGALVIYKALSYVTSVCVCVCGMCTSTLPRSQTWSLDSSNRNSDWEELSSFAHRKKGHQEGLRLGHSRRLKLAEEAEGDVASCWPLNAGGGSEIRST